jgi:thiamine-monophosphate kinase
MNEFDLIRQYFTRPALCSAGCRRRCRHPAPDTGQDLHVSVDMLVEGRHFFADVSPQAWGTRRWQ